MFTPFRLRKLSFIGICSAMLALTLPLLSPSIAFELIQTHSIQAQSLQKQSLQKQNVDGPSPSNNPAISFRRPLRVDNVHISNRWEGRRAQYLFTFDFPADAVEPLEKIVFEQVEGVGYPRFNSANSYAFETESRERLSLSAVENNSNDRAIAVVFDPPVEPGKQVTIALGATNPRDGIYIYQLSAFPAGANVGQYAGVERLNFYRPTRRNRFRYR